MVSQMKALNNLVGHIQHRIQICLPNYLKRAHMLASCKAIAGKLSVRVSSHLRSRFLLLKCVMVLTSRCSIEALPTGMILTLCPTHGSLPQAALKVAYSDVSISRNLSNAQPTVNLSATFHRAYAPIPSWDGK